MKTIFSTVFASALSLAAFAQDVTTVNAYSTEISDNLDLRAVASIFGESSNLEDFERRLNDPKLQISNLDLNNDNQVDYLRVIESVEGNTHLIILQSVLARDVFQDVATVEVEKDIHNNVQVQVVGNVYMYGPNYIYEPVYVSHPVIFTSFWIGGYTPYVSSWYWGYYPRHFYAWHPHPIFRYRRNVSVCINAHNHYKYVNVRRSQRAVALYGGRRSDGYERQYPNRSFQQRHAKVANRYELDQKRNVRDLSIASNTPRNNGVRNSTNVKNNSVRNNAAVRNNESIRTQGNTPRANTRNASSNIRSNDGTRSQTNSTRENTNTRTQVNTPRANTRSEVSAPRENTNVRNRESNFATRNNSNSAESSAQRTGTNQRMISQNRGQRAENNAPRASREAAAPRSNQSMRSQGGNPNDGRNAQSSAPKNSGGRDSQSRR